MLALGFILLLIGVVMLIASSVGPPDAARLQGPGWLIAVIGLILIVVALVLLGDDGDVRTAVAGGLAMAVVPPHAHIVNLDQDPPEPVAGSITDRQPVIVSFIVGAVPLFVAAISAVADLFTGVPSWLVALATIIGTLTTALAALWAKARVTPTAMPRLDEGTPLVPMIESEHV